MRKERGYWTKERCFEVCLEFNNKTDLKNKYGRAYTFLLKSGDLEEACIHMCQKNVKPSGYWTKERCLEEALKYSTMKEFRNVSSAAYNASHKGVVK